MHSRIIVILAILATGCQKSSDFVETNTEKTPFEATPVLHLVLPGQIDEASGIADSKTNPGYLWVHEDGGRPNELSLLSHTGGLLGKMTVSAAINKDWEDMAIAPGPIDGTPYIYLADIGDNDQTYAQHSVYRFPEPVSMANEVREAERIIFEYPDGPHDADAILVDNNTKDIYVITKSNSSSRVYRLAYPQKTNEVNKAAYRVTLPISNITSAAMSEDGQEILARTYDKIYYWNSAKEPSLSPEAVMSKTPESLAHQPEPQGEAICFKNNRGGFFTLSERPEIIPSVALHFYQRR
jgi:hypothetical protein